jgi:hypothetical protein
MNELQGKWRYDPIVGESLYGNQKKQGNVSSERDLMFAILADAIDCYWKYAGARDGRGIKLYQDARRWLFADDREAFLCQRVRCVSFDLLISAGAWRKRQRQRESEPGEIRPHRNRPKKIKRNLKSSTRWKVRPRTVRG